MKQGYEFSSEENRHFRELSLNLLVCGLVLIISAVVMAAFVILSLSRGNSLIGLIFQIGSGSAMLLTGLVMTIKSRFFARIVRTEGHDISELMAGFRGLSFIVLILILTNAIGIALIILRMCA